MSKKTLFLLSIILLPMTCRANDESFWDPYQDQAWFNEQNYFKNFIPLDPPRISAQRYPSIAPEGILQNTLMPLVANIYLSAQDKTHAGEILQSIFKSCRKNWKTEVIRNVCGVIADEHIGTVRKQSNIAFSDLFSLFNKETGIFRGIEFSDLDEIFPNPQYPYMTIRSEYGIGEYLFGIADAYVLEEEDMSAFDGIMMIKAWDTHWQEFAKIIDPTNTSQWAGNEQQRAIGLKDWKLNLLVFSEVGYSGDIAEILAHHFTLQADGERTLTDCFEYNTPAAYLLLSYDEFLKNDYWRYGFDEEYSLLISWKKVPLKQCNADIQVITTLS